MNNPFKPPIVILANGKFPKHKIAVKAFRSAGTLICADGSYNHLTNIGLKPHVIIGDLDSVNDLTNFDGLIINDSNQNNSDLEKCIDWSIINGIKQVAIIGATGLREDMTVNNIMLLYRYFEKIDLNELPELEQLMLHKIYSLNQKFHKYFKNYDFHNLYKELLNFCTVDLSSFYFDIRKDTLYCDEVGSEKRKACITILNIILNLLIRWFAPILSFTTEEIYQLIFKDNKSVHLKNFLIIPENFKNEELNTKWIELISIRNICNISIEEKRASKEIGSSLEADLDIKLDSKLKNITENIDFSELCITSKAIVSYNNKTNTTVITKKAKGEKCPVCWKINLEPCSRHS